MITYDRDCPRCLIREDTPLGCKVNRHPGQERCGINHPGYFVAGEHPMHQCFEEFSSDVSSDLPPDVPATFSEVVQIGRARDTNAVPIAD
jgi:hypothetical protein